MKLSFLFLVRPVLPTVCTSIHSSLNSVRRLSVRPIKSVQSIRPLMRRHVGLIYAINVQRTTRRNFMFYWRVNLCKFPEIQLSVIRKDVTYPISVVSIVTRYKIFVLHNFFIFLRVSKTPFYACIYFFAVFVPTMS